MIKKHLRVLSLGAGVQSTALALMIEKGEQPMVDCAIFSDTQSEPFHVYKHLDWLEKQLSYPLYRVTAGSLKNDILKSAQGIKIRGASIPAFTRNKDTNKKGILRRHCTSTYKIEPLHKKIRELLGVGYKKRVPKDVSVTQIFGISFDEIVRVKTSLVRHITHEYPLVEKQIRRHQCLRWMEQNNYPKPPRSACTFCPFHSNEEWRFVKQNKEEWDEAVMIDKKIRDGFVGTKDYLFLHKSGVPLDEADIRSAEEKGQYSLLDECEGMCGI